MIAHHAGMARTLAEQLGLPDDVSATRSARAYEQWDGKGWPGELEGDDVPIASRIAQLAEFVEVAHRVGGVEAAKALARERRGQAVRPRARRAALRPTRDDAPRRARRGRRPGTR